MQRFAFAGRTCLITGAASGIGAALALDLAKRRAVLEERIRKSPRRKSA